MNLSRKSLLPALVLLLLCPLAMRAGTKGVVSPDDENVIDEIPDHDLRLRLSDLRQEMRTTSLNFEDLVPYRVAATPVSPAEPAWDADVLPQGEVPRRLRFRVLVDIGHGGKDLGALGVSGTLEKNLCLRIGRLVKAELEKVPSVRTVPLEIRLSRDGDRYLTLRERVRLANEWGADLFVSIHANASRYAKARGFEVYFLSSRASDSSATRLASFENDAVRSDSSGEPLKSDVLSMLSDAQTTNHLDTSSRFAETVFQAMAHRLQNHARGVRQGPFTVLAGTVMPAILVEVGYVTHPGEARQLGNETYLKSLASAISTGIIQFADRSCPQCA